MVGEGGGGQVRAPHHKNFFDITRLCEAHSDTPLNLQVPTTNRSFHGFFRVLFKTSWRISIDTAGNSTLKLGNFPS